MAFTPGIYAGGGARGGAIFGGTPNVAATGDPGVGSSGFGIESGFRASVSPAGARVSTTFGIEGLATLAAMLFGLWAADKFLSD